jgi:hypothetical protein
MRRILILSAVLAACTTAPRDIPPANPCDGPEPQIGRTEQSIVAKLGAPSSRDAQKLPNRHDPRVTDEIVTLRYDGAVVTLHTVPEHKASFLAKLEITSERFDLIPGLGIGMSREAAAQRLGLSASSDDELRKTCPSEMPPTIEVAFARDRVSRIVWINEPD